MYVTIYGILMLFLIDINMIKLLKYIEFIFNKISSQITPSPPCPPPLLPPIPPPQLRTSAFFMY